MRSAVINQRVSPEVIEIEERLYRKIRDGSAIGQYRIPRGFALELALRHLEATLRTKNVEEVILEAGITSTTKPRQVRRRSRSGS